MDPWVWIISSRTSSWRGCSTSSGSGRAHLRGRFGPEYERRVQQTGDRRRVEEDLERREERVDPLDVRPLSREDRQRFIDAWRTVQAQFADDPVRAIAEADRLITEVMRVRGYPVTDSEQRAADISVDRPPDGRSRDAARGDAASSPHSRARVWIVT